MRKISFDSFTKETGCFVQVPGTSNVAYNFYRTVDFGDGPMDHVCSIPLTAISDAMNSFGFTAEEALEYHLLAVEAALFPEETATLARSAQAVVSDPDTELLDIFEAATQTVREAINEQYSARVFQRLSAGEDPPPPEMTEEEVADLVFDVLNPSPASISALTAKGEEGKTYGSKRKSLKESRMAALASGYTVDKDSPAWEQVTSALSSDAKQLADSQKVITRYTYQDFIKEGATRSLPPWQEGGGQPTPEPLPDPRPKDTTNNETGDTPVKPVKPGADPGDPPPADNADEEEEAGS